MNAYIFTTFFYPHKGGLENYIYETAKRLDVNRVFIIAFDTENTKKYQEKLENLNIIRIPTFSIKNYYYFNKKPIKLNITKDDIVITHTRFFWSSFIGTLKAKKATHIHIEHGNDFVKHNNKIIQLASIIYDYIFGKYVLKKANKIFAVSKSCQKFVKKLSNKNASILHNCIDDKFFQNKEIENLKIKKKSIAFVGRLVYAKGVQDLIQAFQELKSDYTLYIAGNGDYKDQLKKDENIVYLGELNKEQIKSLLSKTDIFVNPSYNEGLPTSVLEAGIMGCKTIATDVGGTKEILKNKELGLLFNPKDVNQLKKHLKYYMSIKGKNKKLQKHIKDNFSWDNEVKIINRFIKSIKK